MLFSFLTNRDGLVAFNACWVVLVDYLFGGLLWLQARTVQSQGLLVLLLLNRGVYECSVASLTCIASSTAATSYAECELSDLDEDDYSRHDDYNCHTCHCCLYFGTTAPTSNAVTFVFGCVYAFPDHIVSLLLITRFGHEQSHSDPSFGQG